MKFKSLMTAVAVAAAGLAGVASEALAQSKEQFFPSLT